MQIVLVFLSLLAWHPSVSVAATCVENSEVLRSCLTEWSRNYEPSLNQSFAFDSPLDVNYLILAARMRTRTLNNSGLQIRKCIGLAREFAQSCGTPEDRHVFERTDAEVEVMRKRINASQNNGRLAIGHILLRANSVLRKEQWKLNCHLQPLEEATLPYCFVIDKSSARHKFVPLAQADSLPITVGISDLCTFFEDQDGRLISADHCGETNLKRGFLFKLGSPRITARTKDRLTFSQAAFETAPTMEDLAVFTSETSGSGKPFYYLSLDRTLTAGCELRNDLILACSLDSLHELTGFRASMASFPGTYYRLQKNNRRKAASSTLLTEGDLIFDAASERYFVQMYTQAGASGAPVYLEANSVISGVRYDRPLVLGPVSGLSGEMDFLRKDQMTDNIAVIAVLNYSRLAKVLGVIELQVAGEPKDVKLKGPVN